MEQGAMDKAERSVLGEVSLATVAEQAGVSVSTVSRIVNGETGRASADTVARVREAISAVGYRPNHVGRTLRRRESRVVAMLAANLDNPIMATIAAATETALRSAGYVMILCDTHDRADLQDEYLHAMRAQVVKGYVLVGCVASPELERFAAQGAPMVFATRRNPYGGGAFVGIDDRLAGAQVADRFLDRGIELPAVVHPRKGSSATRDRVAGFQARLVERGIGSDRVIEAMGGGSSHLEVGYDAADALFAMSDPPRAVLCVSDQIAYGVYRRARERGIRIPEECYLVSIDGSSLNRWIAPWLASIRIGYPHYGNEILHSLQAIWNGEAAGDRLLPHEFGDLAE